MMRNPRVLMVGNLLSASVGNRAICEEMSERLRARGWSVIATSTTRGRAARLLDMLVTAWRRRREYDVAQVDVFSGPAFTWAEAVCGLLGRLDKPYSLILRGGCLPEFAAREPGRVRRLLAGAHTVIAPSTYLQERLAPACGNIAVIPNAVELAHYPFRLRERPGPRLVWLRSFHAIYNPSMAAEVLAGLPEASLIMIGPDKGDGSLQRCIETARRLGVAGCVTVPGAVPKRETGSWIDRGDIFLNTTDADNMPVSVVEAMACGACIVSTDAGGVRYLLEHERDALLVPTRDPGAMAAAVRRILTEPGLAGRLSANARAKAERFDWSRVLDRFEAVLRGLADARNPSGMPVFN